jgi:hypothetical protein
MTRPQTILCLCLYALLSNLNSHAAQRNASQALSFFEPPFIHPALIKILAGGLSDRHPNIVALDLDEAQTSNQIVGASDYTVITDDSDSSQAPWVQMSETHAHGETTYFKYRADKQDSDGTLYLRCYSWGGGSGYWSKHVAVKIIADTQRRYDANDQPYLHRYRMLKLVSQLPMDFFE